MKKPRWFVPFGLLFFLAFACRQNPSPSPSAKALELNAKPDIQADVAAIKGMEDEFVRLYNACEFDKLMAYFYADDIVLMAPAGPPIHGKDALLRSYLKDDALNIEHVKTSVVEDVRVSGNLAVARGRDTGTTTSRKGGKPVPYDLKWVMAFERQADHTWKCCYEIWCENPLVDAREKASPAGSTTRAADEELRALELQWNDALVKSDVAFLDRVLADDYMFTNPDGRVLTKAELLAETKSGEDVYASAVTHDMKVRVYGDAAVVTGHSAYKEAVKGKDISGEYRWTDTWARVGGRWQCVADHASKVR